MDREQIGRRNLTPDQRRLHLGESYNRRKRDQGGTGANQHEQSGQNVHSAKTAEAIAEEAGVNEKTVRRAGSDAEALAAAPELRNAVRAARLPMRDALDALDLDPDVQREIAAVDADGTAERVMIDDRAPTGDTP